MDKKSLLAIVLVMVVVMIAMMFQSGFFSSGNQDTAATATQTQETVTQTAETQETEPVVEEVSYAIEPVGKAVAAEKFYFETDLYLIEFDTSGASISSLLLKNHKAADGEPLFH